MYAAKRPNGRTSVLICGATLAPGVERLHRPAVIDHGINSMLLSFETVSRTASSCIVDAAGNELEYGDLASAEAEVGLVRMLSELIDRHGVPSALAVAAGPGSFTGIRVGIVAARTLSWMDRLPVHAVDSLAACAAQAGDGLWWVLLPLKRDTTFHGLFRVESAAIEVLAATTAELDAAAPTLHSLTASAVAIGPALAAKPDLARRWCPGIVLGDVSAPNARGVARAARGEVATTWDRLLPAYHQEPSPVLQRRARV